MAHPWPACQVQPGTTFDLFRDRLPRAPYHTDELSEGLRIAYRHQAEASRYIQPNGPTHRYWLVYDVDRSGAALDWSDRNAPPPSIVATNPTNGHAHLLYGLQVAVRTAPDAKSGPLRYLAAVDCALRDVLEADPGYSGLICKNPLRSDAWRVASWEPRLYELGDLDSWLDLSAYNDRRRRLPDYGLGRNSNLFDTLSRWAYRAIRQGWPEYRQWLEAVHQRARGYNAQFSDPLPANEVRHTSASVARFTHTKFSPAGFSAWQAAQGRKGGKAKGAAYTDRRTQALAMLASGASQKEVAERVGVHRNTVRNWAMHK